MQHLLNKITLGDCVELMKELPNESVDCVCTDVPYTDGKTDVLNGHKIQTKLNIPEITKEFYRILKPNTFYAFFGQMPTILAWYNAAIEAGFKFRVDIIWAKKQAGIGGNQDLRKSHELIWIMSKGSPNYYKTEGDWFDVSQAMCENNLMDIESIFRHLSYWKSKALGGNPKNVKRNNKKSNDSYYDKSMRFKESYTETFTKETKQFNSVWAFAPHNKQGFNNPEFNIQHPTVKPIQVMERLVELLTPNQNDIILDTFIGSGTTALACLRTNRQFIGFEIDETYFQIASERVAKEKAQTKLF